eukprot:Clim_evm65s225 gene=Clim_evmTU65s225
MLRFATTRLPLRIPKPIPRFASRSYASASETTPVTIKATGVGMTTVVEAGKYKWNHDEPKEMGGAETGADPVSGFAGSLAACEQVVVMVCANELGIKVGKIDWDVTLRFSMPALMGDPEPPKHVTQADITATMEISDATKITELRKQVEARCPLYNTFVQAGTEVNHVFTAKS